MRVLFLAHAYPRVADDPVGSFVLRLAVALRPAGVEVRVVAPGGEGLSAEETFEGITVERFRYAPRSLETLAYTGTMRHQVMGSWASRVAMASFLAAQGLKGLRTGRSFRPDIVHAHWWFPAGLVGTWLAPRWKAPLVTTLHGSDLRLAQDVKIATRLFRHVMARSTAVTTVSRWLKEGTEALAPGTRPVVAPMPVLPDLFAPGGRREPNRLLFVGKLNPQKGITHLLRALTMMKSKPTVDIVVGVGSAPEDIQDLVRELKVSDQLRWHPLLPQAQLARLYREATALVSPFVDEGLGLVAIEAQLSGMPVVAFRSGGLTDIVEDGRTGLLVPPGHVAELAQALDRLLALGDAGAEWGREGRRRALATFAPEAVAQRYVEIYRGALSAKHGAAGVKETRAL
jgi:glycosyltransferase involved in cell wall biosynthesis